jgi:hypothetical protein
MSYWRQGEPVADVEFEEGIPTRFTWRGRMHPIKDIANVWRIDDAWWHERVWRDYYKLITATGLLVILAHDLTSNEWRLIRIYD